MVEYECKLAYRPRFGPFSKCNTCITDDCTNPIFDVDVTLMGMSQGKERLYSDSEKPPEERTLRDYYSVLDCEGYREKPGSEPNDQFR